MVDESFGLGAFHEDFSHVGDVEHAHVLTDGEMLPDDGAVLDGHHEAGKRTHFGLKGHM